MQRVEMSTGQEAQGDFHDANEISALGGYYPIHSLTRSDYNWIVEQRQSLQSSSLHGNLINDWCTQWKSQNKTRTKISYGAVELATTAEWVIPRTQ